MARVMSFADALAEGTVLAMERDPAVFVMGVGVDDPGGVFGSTRLPHQRFGDARVFDTPISENSLTGVAVGAALTGMRPMLVHARTDFLPLTLDQLANHAAKWSYMAGGALKAPIVVRAVIGRGWGQAAQHSQSLQAIVAHFPGLQVVMPAAPADAKGLLLSALTGDHPVVCLEHRWSYGQTGEVPEGWHPVPIGRARVAREGTHLTFVAASQMVHECLRAAEVLARDGVEAEVIDLRSVRPWDVERVCEHVRRTGRLVIADTGWTTFGISAEIAARVGEELFGALRAPVRRVGLPPVPTPCAPSLERVYYPTADDLVRAARSTLHDARDTPDEAAGPLPLKPFQGPF